MHFLYFLFQNFLSFSQRIKFMIKCELIQGFWATLKTKQTKKACPTGCVSVTEPIQRGPNWPTGNFHDKCLTLHLPLDPRKYVLITCAIPATPGAERCCTLHFFSRDLPPRSRNWLQLPGGLTLLDLDVLASCVQQLENITEAPSQEGVPKTYSSFRWQWQKTRNAPWRQSPAKLYFLSGSQSSSPPALCKQVRLQNSNFTSSKLRSWGLY